MYYSTKAVLPENEKIQPAARDAGSGMEVVLPENERESSRPPETAVPVLNLYYQSTTIQPAAGDGGFSIKVVLCQ